MNSSLPSRRRASSHDTDPLDFVRVNTRLAPISSLPGIRIHMAHPGTGLSRLAGEYRTVADLSPYWAFAWAGGLALARHMLDHPEIVRGKRVLDLGSGSGLVGIAAARAGASAVIAADIDPCAAAATTLNAEANGAAVTVIERDLTGGPPPDVDLIAAGDIFYDRDLAARMTAFFDRCLASGIAVLVGDPYRAYLPLTRLERVAEYAVADVGDGPGDATRVSGVFTFLAAGR